ncbi:Os11g0598000 [Oryza sativa Japonica Group]|uniref:F-box domain containing protein n=3 Tax=Oryza TaxID=4527 RepID=Q0IRT8_ORYSJ|nr:F-box domain containing protein [Oryza sativa Japonica Group]USI00243.1 F-box and DUF domain-containing protein [Oryza sativa Japonica Group]BAF28577.2 Os11g0598000 [Oryza sativa Japonica Group]|eukprot:NP_001068214.2 Os11g0598000 [Oryza sativa Japonica Group]
MELPQDILMSIFSTLEILDLIRAGSVCNSWRSAYTSICSLGHCKPQQTPCLLYTFESDSTKATGLYSLAEKKAYMLTLLDPALPSRFIIGSSHGWIITADERSELHLVNPITGKQIALPPVTTIEQLSIARSGDDKWTWLPPHKDYEDCIFRDGLLYALTSEGEIYEYDLSGPAITRKIVLNKVWRSYDPLDDEDEDASDDLEADHDDESYVWNTTMIKVHKVDLVARMLVEACDLGENVLILGHNQSLCLRADEYPLLKANHVYLSDDRELYIKGCKNGCRDIGVFNLENNCAEEIVSPQLWSNWPPPVWMTPNARKISLETHSL